MKHIYNESENKTDSCDVGFDSKNWWNIPKMVPVIGMESMTTHTRLRYTQDYLTPDICSLSKPITMETRPTLNADKPSATLDPYIPTWSIMSPTNNLSFSKSYVLSVHEAIKISYSYHLPFACQC